jgi:hypothetical protein
MNTIKLSFLTILFACTTVFVNAQSLPVKNAADRITNAYIGIKNALVTDDAGLAQLKAKDMLSVLSGDLDKDLKPEQKKLLAAYIEKLRFDSRHISESATIEHQREHFANLSKNMFTVLKGLKMNSLTVYKQYCPMKKAVWISETVTIKNPYYGKQMLDCGSTQETL